MAEPGDDAGGAATTLGEPLAVAESLDEQRRRELLRARLFGEAPRPVKIGRFTLLDRLGAGAMGVVYAAYDDVLDRKVALKVLRPGADASRQGREARALARLSHPNVVTVHEVGVSDDQVFIAMEHVAGRTLRAHLEQPRPWAEVLGLYVQAGRGLSAAHDQGLVHRDFKPDNVMIGDDGRVRVVDFGLVREGPAQGAGGAASGAVGTSTSAGLVGTPAYMAPEQIAGGAVDARADQFAFCVSLYEGLYRERPFAASSLDEACKLALLGEVRPAPRGSDVPSWLREVLLRGLAPDPSARFASMNELVAALTRQRRDPRRLALWALVLVAVAAAAALLARRRDELLACPGAAPRLDEVWGPSHKASVRDAVLGSGAGFAAQTWPIVEAGLDRYAGAWASMHTEACVAHLRREQSAELLDLRMGCLERRRQGIAALVATLSTPRSPAIVERAAQAVASLEPLESCADASLLRGETRAPASLKADVDRLEARLARARASRDAGLYAEGHAEAVAITEAAIALGHAPLVAAALQVRGDLEASLGRLDEATSTLEEAFEKALSARDDAAAARAGGRIIAVLSQQGSAEAARPYERSAFALATRVGDPRLVAEVRGSRALTRGQRGELTAALEDHTHAVEATERLFGASHPELAFRQHNLANALRDQGKRDLHLSLSRQALATAEASLGPDHPEVATLLNGLATALLAEGDRDEAERLLLRAKAIVDKGLGEGHPRGVITLMNLALLRSEQGDRDGAEELFKRATALLDGGKLDNPARLGRLLSNLGATLCEQRKSARAVEVLERAVSLLEASSGPTHPDVGRALSNLGVALAQAGRVDDAARAYQRAASIFEQRLPPGHPNIAAPLVGLGELLLDQHRPREAVPPLERALTIHAARPGNSTKRAAVRFSLARAVYARAQGREGEADTRRAIALATESLAEYERADALISLPASRVKAFLEVAAEGRPFE